MENVILNDFTFNVKFPDVQDNNLKVISVVSTVIVLLETNSPNAMGSIEKMACIEMMNAVDGSIFIGVNDPDIELFKPLDSENIFKVIVVEEELSADEFDWLSKLIIEYLSENLKVSQVFIFKKY